MSRLLYGAIADDDTGASDLAGMLAGAGVRTVLLIDLDARDRWPKVLGDYDAAVVGVATRALPVAEARKRTRAAAEALLPYHPETLQLKYCSTFDSTDEGNIGPAIDELMDLMGVRFTVALPALPVNGRTTYMGYHFVHQQLLSESSMRDHPLTPMRNAHLVSHLQAQTQRRVGLLPLAVVREGHAAIREGLESLKQDGIEIALLDCVSDVDLEELCRVLPDLRLITGSSAPAMHWRRFSFARNRKVAAQSLLERAREARSGGLLVVSGSCSPATLEQDRRFEATGVRTFAINVAGILEQPENVFREVVPEAAAALQGGDSILLKTDKSTRYGRDREGANTTGLRIAAMLADLVARVSGQCAPAGILSAGGETSSALCRRLEIWALHVDRNLCPGVPLCFTLDDPPLPIVLKSGNFGTPDFYSEVESVIRGDATATTC